jgi:uncharacterized membrane protein (UPF0127 family)
VRAVLLALILAGCSRAPQEPAPAASTRAGEQTVVIPPAAPSAASIPVASVACPHDPDGPSPLPTASVSLPSGTTLTVELARSTRETERGLMFRTSLPEDHGMLFLLGRREDHAFWMHNTCIPLDLLFLDEDGTIVGILEDLPILNDTPRSVGRLSVNVLEVNTGWCKRHGLKPGQKLVLPPAIQ